MWKICVLALLAVVVNAGYYEELTARRVPEIMKTKPSWVAGYNKYLAGKSEAQLRRLAGTKLDKPNRLPMVHPKPKTDAALPAEFDARTQWPQCPEIGFIRDQADCGSCWAVSSSAAMGDRTCIAYGAGNDANGDQTKTLYLSDEDVMACCSFCGSGCDGGYPEMAWQYWVRDGVVTGGPYDSKQGCMPYEEPPESFLSAVQKKPGDTPACEAACEKGYALTYKQDKHKGASGYAVGNGVQGMQQELFDNGPIVSAFTVYEDFYNYVSGVYVRDTSRSNREVGGHAVEVIGWGNDQASGLDYWLVKNSWNASWGMQGLFKIVRGTNDCGFEQSISAGLAKAN
jgi:cathepsin B